MPGRAARARKAGAKGATGGDGAPARHGSRVGRLLQHLDRIGQAYTADIHGADAVEAVAGRRGFADVPERPEFFSIYSDTAYRSGDHMEMLTGFLGFRFDDLPFSFT